jgi:anti-sigma factor RsiW
MNLDRDDDSRLSGYLDGELDPAEREAVEAARAADPALAARLDELEAVRRQLGALSRPLAPRDVAANVLARIDHDPRTRARTILRRRPVLAWSGLAAAAALAILAVRPPDLGGTNPGASTRPRGGRPTARLEAGPGAGGLAAASASAVAAVPAASPAPGVTPGPLALAAEVAAERERDRVRALLDRPGVRRLVVVVDAITPRTLTSVEDALRETPRAEPLQGRLRIGQGIVLDPERPGEAVVYTVVLDDQELGHLRHELAERLNPGQVAEATEPAAPELVTQLADVGSVLVTEGRPAAPPLVEPPALPGGTSLAHDIAPPDATPREVIAAETARGAGPGPVAAAVPPAARPAEPTPPSPSRRVTLVWVTARAPGVRDGGT